MGRTFAVGILLLTAVLLAVLSLISCAGNEVKSNTNDLPFMGVREYDGINLSSINEFRENSIA